MLGQTVDKGVRISDIDELFRNQRLSGYECGAVWKVKDGTGCGSGSGGGEGSGKPSQDCEFAGDVASRQVFCWMRFLCNDSKLYQGERFGSEWARK